MIEPDKKMYWYMTTIIECVLCGHSDRYRERKYTLKPKNPCDRIKVVQTACGSHFM